ncbi:MAG: DUF3088 domain-containing protein [Verrucomicrobia bacterium]|nr:DUF3088 domain-containing protein [Verrucomicrobiota bacterium]
MASDTTGAGSRDHLFLLSPLFPDAKLGPGLYHCPECAQVEGLLSFFPFLRSRLEVSYVDFPRPRAAVVPLVGPENQGCPVLVLGAGSVAPAGAKVGPAGRAFVSGAAAISTYLAAAHGISQPH